MIWEFSLQGGEVRELEGGRRERKQAVEIEQDIVVDIVFLLPFFVLLYLNKKLSQCILLLSYFGQIEFLPSADICMVKGRCRQ